MRKRMAVIGIGGAFLVSIVIGGVAVASGGDDGDDGDVTVTGPQAARATAAALDATKGGAANSVERDSENGATWEVEVNKTDGTTVDVRLDENYQVVVIESDSESG